MTLEESNRVLKATLEQIAELRRIITRLELENDELKQKLKTKRVANAKQKRR